MMSDSNREDVTDDALVSVLHHLKAQTGYMHDGWFGYSYGPEDAKVNLVAYDTNKYKLVKKDLAGVDMDVYEALVQGAEKAKERFLNRIEDEQVSGLFEKLESQFKRNHFLLSQAAKTLDKGLEPIFEKNSELIQEQLQFLRNKIQQSVNSKHSHELAKYNRITNALRPNGGPQERTTNIYYFLNQYGPEFMNELMDLNFESNSFHKVVVL